MSFDFYFSQEWALKHNKSLWKDKNYDEEDDMAIRELFDQLDEDHSNTIEHCELLKMMKNLHINPDWSRLPKYFGFVGEHSKTSLSFEEFRDLVSSNKYKHRLYGDVESVNNINELIEFVNSLRRYNLKMSLSKTETSQESVDIYKQLFVLPLYYTGMYNINESKDQNTVDIWQKMKRAMRALHTVNEKVNKTKQTVKYHQRRTSKINSKDKINSGRRISSLDINEEKERINRLAMTLPAIIKKENKKEDKIERPETTYYYTPIPPISSSPHKNNILRKKRSVIIKPLTSPKRVSQFYEINENGEVLPKYSPVKCV